MISTLWNFIVRGILLNAAVFLGLLGGVLAYIYMPLDRLYALCFDYRLYFGFFVFAFFDACIFHRSYKDNYRHIDWGQSIFNVFKKLFFITFSFFVGVIGMYYIDSTELNIHYNDPERAEYNRFFNLEQKIMHE